MRTDHPAVCGERKELDEAWEVGQGGPVGEGPGLPGTKSPAEHLGTRCSEHRHAGAPHTQPLSDRAATPERGSQGQPAALLPGTGHKTITQSLPARSGV